MAHRTHRHGVQDPRLLVHGILLTRQKLDIQGFLALVRGQYDLAVDRRDEHWIWQLQRECTDIALSEEHVLRFFPNPFGRNFRTAPKRPQTISNVMENQVMCRDIRRLDNPDIPELRTDTAESASGTSTAVTDTSDVGPQEWTMDVEDSSCRSQLTGDPTFINVPTKELRGFLCRQGLTRAQMSDLLMAVPRVTSMEFYRSEPVTQYELKSDGYRRQRPSSRSSGHFQQQHRSQNRNTNKDRSPICPAIDVISSMTFFNKKYRADRSDSPSDGSKYHHRGDKLRQDLHLKERVHRTTVTNTGKQHSVSDMAATVVGNKRIVNNRTSRKRGREECSQQSPRTKRKVCPVKGRREAVGKLKSHLRQVHIPGLFHDEETAAELGNTQFQSLQKHALEMLARFLFGSKGVVRDLVHLVNEKAEIKDSRITP